MSFAAIRSGEAIPVYNGMNYLYWKDKMMQNIISVDPTAQTIVKDEVHVEDLANPTEDEKRKQGLDAQVWVFITNHVTPDQYHQVKIIPSANGVWDYLERLVKVLLLRNMLALTLSVENSIASLDMRVKMLLLSTTNSL